MSTKNNNFNTQYLTDVYATVVGLYGDPANQVVTDGGTNLLDAFSYISWADATVGNRNAILFWSRVLLVELLRPNDSSYAQSSLAFVLKPRSCWLYDYNGSLVSDYIGNTANPTTLGTVSDNSSINEIMPPYRFGDVIRVSVLPAPINISNSNGFFDNYYKQSEYYDNKSIIRNPILNITNTLQINGAAYKPIYNLSTLQSILYYDKNVDARTRFSTPSTETGDLITVPVCQGGVTKIYQIKGYQIG